MSKWLSIFNGSSHSTSSAKIAKIDKSINTEEFSNANTSDKIAKIAKIRDENNFGNFDSFGRLLENSEISQIPKDTEYQENLKASDEKKFEDYFKLFEERAARFENEDSLPRTEAEYQAYLVILADFIMLSYPSIKTEFDSLIFPGKAKHRK
jgi:hypothetical protein